MDSIASFLSDLHPYSTLTPAALSDVAARFEARDMAPGEVIYTRGTPATGLFIIRGGEVAIRDAAGAELSRLKTGNSFGERGLMRDGIAATTAVARTGCKLLLLPAADFHALRQAEPAVARFFERGEARRAPERPAALAAARLADLMTRGPLTCAPDTPATEAARMMQEAGISCLLVTEGERLTGIVTIRDLSGRVLGRGLPPATPVAQVMTPDPLTLPPSALGTDVLHLIMERRIGHVPVVEGGRLLGIVTRTDLMRQQAVTSGWLISSIAEAEGPAQIAAATARIPAMLLQLTGAGNRHDVTTRLITDVADAATRRLLVLAEAELGPPPVPYLWLACGSQGRMEQAGVSDQDNCLILDDAVTQADLPYFDALAAQVTEGLNAAGYVFCPGEMMASTPRWRQPLSVWRSYFQGWIDRPVPEAQMLASVMFDLRPIRGETALYEALHRDTLEAASKNSIFVAHMIANSLKHQPPLGLFRSIARIRSGDHKDSVDLKMSGVVPVVDLARLYALMGRLEPVSTRARIESAAGGPVSASGARDLLDAYDLIAETRLRHQARQIRDGQAPDNYLVPSELSDFERAHLRDAFVVVRTMQSAIGQGRATVS